MNIYEVELHYYNLHLCAYYIVRATSEQDAVDQVFADRSLGSESKDDVEFTATKIDVSKPHFVTEV